MKREIKFRGMDIKDNWYYGLFSITEEYGYTISNSIAEKRDLREIQ